MSSNRLYGVPRYFRQLALEMSSLQEMSWDWPSYQPTDGQVQVDAVTLQNLTPTRFKVHIQPRFPSLL